jgi:uncharacterized protein
MGNPFVHIELATDDVGQAKKFYKSLFKWKLPPWGEGYTGVDVGKGTGGGMMQKHVPQQPTMWLPYVEVDSVKKTVAKAKKLGASVQVEFMEIGKMGAFGVFTDPTGAAIGVWESAKKRKAAKKKGKKK